MNAFPAGAHSPAGKENKISPMRSLIGEICFTSNLLCRLQRSRAAQSVSSPIQDRARGRIISDRVPVAVDIADGGSADPRLVVETGEMRVSGYVPKTRSIQRQHDTFRRIFRVDRAR